MQEKLRQIQLPRYIKEISFLIDDLLTNHKYWELEIFIITGLVWFGLV